MTRRSAFQKVRIPVRLVGGSIQFSMNGSGVNEWLDRQDRFATAAEDLQEPFREFGDYMTGSISRNFGKEGRPRRWTPLSEKYARWKAKHFSGRKILVLSGRLKRKATSKKAWVATKKQLRYKPDVPLPGGLDLFSIHQQGLGLPARQMLVLQDRDKAQFTRIMRKHLYD